MENSNKEQEIKRVRHDFSASELKVIAANMAALSLDIIDLEDEKKVVATQYKERIESKAADRKISARKYSDGFEMRDVACYVVRDYDDGVIRYIRVDNGEEVEAREMTANERQMRIDDAA